MTEADVIINGKPLSFGQAMALRVACTTFHMDMADPEALGDDEHGRAMTAAYRQRLTEVLQLLIAPA